MATEGAARERGVALPVDAHDGRRSSTGVGRSVVAEAVRTVAPDPTNASTIML